MSATLPDADGAAGSGPGLDRLHVAVVGAGRLGHALIHHLDALGVARIDVYERDRTAAAPLHGRVAVYDGDFWDELTLARLQEYDFAVCTIPDGAARARLNQKCLVASVNLLQAWTEGSTAIAEAYPFGAMHDCACVECDAQGDPAPLAALKLSVTPAADDASTTSVAGGLAAALLSRVAAGAHGFVARRATLDATRGEGTSVELRRDPRCRCCGALERPVPIVHTRNRWAPSDSVAAACPEALAQPVRLSDDIDGFAGRSCRIDQLIERFGAGPIPAKFALTEVGGRTICLDFEELRGEPKP